MESPPSRKRLFRARPAWSVTQRPEGKAERFRSNCKEQLKDTMPLALRYHFDDFPANFISIKFQVASDLHLGRWQVFNPTVRSKSRRGLSCTRACPPS